MKIQVIHWDIEIIPQDDGIFSAQMVFDNKSQEYKSFINGIKAMMEAKDYQFIVSYDSPYEDSNSKYYEFLKVTDELKIKVVISVRVSDHIVPDSKREGQPTSSKRRRSNYLLTKRVPELMKEFNTTEIPVVVPVDIVFDDKHFWSYFEALKYINNLINNRLS